MKIHWKLVVWAGLLFWFWFYLPYLIAAPAPIAITVTPQQGFAPLSVRAKVLIEPNYLNRAACLVWDSDSGDAGSSCWQLEGQYAPRTRFYELKELSGGEYLFQATLYQVREQIFSNKVPVNVIGQF